MAGSIFKDNKIVWSAASWLFGDLVRFTAEAVADQEVKSRLNEIEENNLGSLALDNFSPEQQRIICDAMLRAAIPRLETLDFHDPSFKPDALKQLHELRAVLERQ